MGGPRVPLGISEPVLMLEVRSSIHASMRGSSKLASACGCFVRRPSLGQDIQDCSLSFLFVSKESNMDLSYQALAAHASSHTLQELVDDKQFVDAVSALVFDEEGNDELFLCTVLVDMFHDHFGLTAARGRHVTKAIMEQSHSLRELFDMNAQLNAGTYIAPNVSAHVATGLLGPYPASQGNATPEPEVKSDTTERVVDEPLGALAPPEQESPDSVDSAAPPARFGDIAGVVMQQPLAQVVKEVIGPVGFVEPSPAPEAASITADLAAGAPMFTEAGTAPTKLPSAQGQNPQARPLPTPKE